VLKKPPHTVLKMGRTTKTTMKIPENNRLIKRTGSRKIKANSRNLRFRPANFTFCDTGLKVEVCMLFP
jgi:hypothetical protein